MIAPASFPYNRPGCRMRSKSSPNNFAAPKTISIASGMDTACDSAARRAMTPVYALKKSSSTSQHIAMRIRLNSRG